MTKATWINGKRTVTGQWVYNWSSDHFYIELDSIDRITHQNRRFTVHGDKPEWGNWKLAARESSDADES